MKRIICGPRAVSEALKASPQQINVIFIESSQHAKSPLVRLARDAAVHMQPCDREHLERLAEGLRHQGVVAITGFFPYRNFEETVDEALEQREPLLLVALDQVQDVGNVGSLVRSSVAFGAHGLVLCRHHAAAISPTVVRISAGATEHGSVSRVTNLARSLDFLREQDVTIVGLDSNETLRLDQTDLTGPIALLLGSEGKGLRRQVRRRCDVVASIPIPGPISSLNVAMAGAVALYEVRRQRGQQP